MALKRMVLELDDLDYQVIQREVALRQRRGTLPATSSCIAGTAIADAIRDLEEYRNLYDLQNNNKGSTES